MYNLLVVRNGILFLNLQSLYLPTLVLLSFRCVIMVSLCSVHCNRTLSFSLSSEGLLTDPILEIEKLTTSPYESEVILEDVCVYNFSQTRIYFLFTTRGTNPVVLGVFVSRVVTLLGLTSVNHLCLTPHLPYTLIYWFP